jgi:hypothetical protein
VIYRFAEGRHPQNIEEIVQLMTTVLDGIDRDLETLEDDFVSGKLDASFMAASSSASPSPPLTQPMTRAGAADSSTDSGDYDPGVHDTATLRIVKKGRSDGYCDEPEPGHATETAM